MGYTNATIDSVNLNITKITPTRKQKKVKQELGYSVIQIGVLGLREHQWNLNISGVITGTTIDADREALEDLDDASPHVFTDGLHNGTYYIEPGSITFSDDGASNFSHYNYSMKLFQQ